MQLPGEKREKRKRDNKKKHTKTQGATAFMLFHRPFNRNTGMLLQTPPFFDITEH